MIANQLQRSEPKGKPASALHLVFATAITAAAVGGCRLVVHLFSMDPMELDGFVLVAALYWLMSVVGYFAAPSASQRKSPKVGKPWRRASRTDYPVYSPPSPPC